MRYIANDSGQVLEVSFGAMIVCGGRGCTEYVGDVPAGYDSLVDWFTQEGDKLHRWQIVEGNLTKIEEAPEPPAAVPLSIVKLWKNPSPTASYSAQTLDIPGLAKCDYVLINFNALNTSNCFGVDLRVFKERDGQTNYVTHARYDSGVYVSSRSVTVNFETDTVVFGAGSQNGNDNANRMIPLFIVGFTGVIDKTIADDETRAICGTFLCGEVVAGQ